MRIHYAVVALLFVTLHICAFVDISIGGHSGILVSILPQPYYQNTDQVSSNDRYRSRLGIAAGINTGSALEITARINHGKLGLSFENTLNFLCNTLFFEAALIRIGFSYENTVNFKWSPFDHDIRCSSFFVGIGSGADYYYYAWQIANRKEYIFYPLTNNYAVAACGIEYFVRHSQNQENTPGQYALKLCPRLFAAIGINRSDSSLHINDTKPAITIDTENLVTAGYPEIKLGVDITISMNIDLAPFFSKNRLALTVQHF